MCVEGKSRCSTHALAVRPKRSSTQNDSFYKSTAWTRLRSRKIQLTPLCEHCSIYGVLTAGHIIDHVIELNDGGAAMDYNNLQTLCLPCHNTKTAKAKRARQ